MSREGPGVGVILLAAGESTRMGEPKQLLDWQGLPLLHYQIRELQWTTASEIVVVLGHRADEFLPLAEEVKEPGRTMVIINGDYRLGKTTSVKAGIEILKQECEGMMILALDQPRPAAVLQKLIDAHLGGDHLITIPSHKGKHGHPPIIHGQLRSELGAISEERQGLREVIRSHLDRTGTVEVDDAIVLSNLNRPEDYRRWHEK